MDEKSVREGYVNLGVDGYYKKHEKDYYNPHESIIKKLLLIAIEKNLIEDNILDLCCGSGEVTSFLKDYNVTGLDPYTALAYKERTGKNVLEYTFKDIALGKLSGYSFQTIICSFALHLCPESMLLTVLWRLGEISNRLIIITPHKRPDCDKKAGWCLVEEIIVERVKMRIYLK